MPKDKKPAKAPKMCKYTNGGEDKAGRTIYCNRWLDSKGNCPEHGKRYSY